MALASGGEPCCSSAAAVTALSKVLAELPKHQKFTGGLEKATLAKAQRHGKFPGLGVGGGTRKQMSDLEQFLKSMPLYNKSLIPYHRFQESDLT